MVNKKESLKLNFMKVIKMNRKILDLWYEKKSKTGSHYWTIEIENEEKLVQYYNKTKDIPFKIGSIISYELIDKGYWFPILKLHKPKLKTIT